MTQIYLIEKCFEYSKGAMHRAPTINETLRSKLRSIFLL